MLKQMIECVFTFAPVFNDVKFLFVSELMIPSNATMMCMYVKTILIYEMHLKRIVSQLYKVGELN